MDFSVIQNEVRDFLAHDTTGHDYWHSVRVYNNARTLAQSEKCDEEIVGLAALLHDVDDRKLFATADYDNAKRIMVKCGIDADVREKVVNIISEVSFRGTDSVVPDSIEGKVVQDADRLDAMGAIGIARTFTYGGSRGRKMYDPDIKPNTHMDAYAYLNNQGTSLNHFYEKLLLLKDMMNTDAARKIAEKRDRYMKEFLNEFIEECNI